MAVTRLNMRRSKLKLLSPAKLNLFLNINRRLDNGYHELQSLFHFIDFGDDMTFEAYSDESQFRTSKEALKQTNLEGWELEDWELAGKAAFNCNLPELETNSNLVFKAMQALSRFLKAKFGENNFNKKLLSLDFIKISLTKRLPMGGGVGGGSSNAATTLLALNSLWELGLSLDELREVGLMVGADVPIFIFGQTAIADGVGEKLTSYPIKEKWYLVLTPNQHVNTAELFSSPHLPRNSPKLPLDEIKYQGIAPQFKNDFEKLVYNQYPTVAKAMDWLLEYGPARMTGTGACVYAEFATQDEANEIYQQLPVDLTGFVAKGCNISPTHQTLFG